jgi:hypothetical protein
MALWSRENPIRSRERATLERVRVAPHQKVPAATHEFPPPLGRKSICFDFIKQGVLVAGHDE